MPQKCMHWSGSAGSWSQKRPKEKHSISDPRTRYYPEYIDHISHHTPVPLLDLLQHPMVALVLLLVAHLQQGWLQDYKSLKHEERWVPASLHILPEQENTFPVILTALLEQKKSAVWVQALLHSTEIVAEIVRQICVCTDGPEFTNCINCIQAGQWHLQCS